MTRLIIDAHVHPQRFTPGFLKEGERFTYDKLENAIMSELPFGNSLMIAGMDRLGIIYVERNAEAVRGYPPRREGRRLPE